MMTLDSNLNYTQQGYFMINKTFILALSLLSLPAICSSGRSAKDYEDSADITNYINRMDQISNLNKKSSRADLIGITLTIGSFLYKGYVEYSKVRNTVSNVASVANQATNLATEINNGFKKQSEDEINFFKKVAQEKSQEVASERANNAQKDMIINELSTENSKLAEKERLLKSVLVDQTYEILATKQAKSLFSLSELDTLVKSESNPELAQLFKRKFDLALEDAKKNNPKGDYPPLTPRSLRILQDNI